MRQSTGMTIKETHPRGRSIYDRPNAWPGQEQRAPRVRLRPQQRGRWERNRASGRCREEGGEGRVGGKREKEEMQIDVGEQGAMFIRHFICPCPGSQVSDSLPRPMPMRKNRPGVRHAVFCKRKGGRMTWQARNVNCKRGFGGFTHTCLVDLRFLLPLINGKMRA